MADVTPLTWAVHKLLLTELASPPTAPAATKYWFWIDDAGIAYFRGNDGVIHQLLDDAQALAELIAYDNASSGLTATDIQAAIDELAASGGAPSTAKYIVQEANGGLSAEQSLGALTTGLLLNTVTAGVGVLSTAGASNLPTGIDATKIADGSISNTEFQYLKNVSSNIQTQIDGKAASSHTHAATDVGSGNVDNTEFGHLNGVSANIQTQLDAKPDFSFQTINCPSGTDPVADSAADTLNLAAGDGMKVTGDNTTDTVTFSTKFATGTYVGNGSTTQAITGLGFQPKHLRVDIQNDGSGWWSFYKTNNDSTKTFYIYVALQYENDIIISLDADGFTVGDSTGADAGTNQLNINGYTYTFVAWG